jgi:DNA-binding NarL/FixJ family response regulator
MDPQNVQGGGANPLRVFIVEDAVNMQMALHELVCSVADAEVVGVVASEGAAVAWVDSNAGHWDLAIVDLTLEEGDGFNIVRRLKQEPECGALVVFSGYVTDVIRRYCRSLGAHAVFHKTESRQLAEFIEEFAGSRLTS